MVYCYLEDVLFLKQLELKNYRNYKDLNVKFKSNITLITGKNAQGKTNLLEAIQFLASLGTNRAKTDNELILWGENFFNISGNLEKNTFDYAQARTPGILFQKYTL